ncbi:unnamed protein product (mitochondrion) [Parajaminaea phylloscopi]|uniref:Uncharacterized protein n=1 Tax=Parajaminaea phylloscopi TaxID=1463510 RepID=A0AB39A6Z3_9BASI
MFFVVLHYYNNVINTKTIKENNKTDNNNNFSTISKFDIFYYFSNDNNVTIFKYKDPILHTSSIEACGNSDMNLNNNNINDTITSSGVISTINREIPIGLINTKLSTDKILLVKNSYVSSSYKKDNKSITNPDIVEQTTMYRSISPGISTIFECTDKKWMTNTFSKFIYTSMPFSTIYCDNKVELSKADITIVDGKAVVVDMFNPIESDDYRFLPYYIKVPAKHIINKFMITKNEEISLLYPNREFLEKVVASETLPKDCNTRLFINHILTQQDLLDSIVIMLIALILIFVISGLNNHKTQIKEYFKIYYPSLLFIFEKDIYRNIFIIITLIIIFILVKEIDNSFKYINYLNERPIPIGHGAVLDEYVEAIIKKVNNKNKAPLFFQTEKIKCAARSAV